MSRSATYGYDQRCEIFGDLGMATVQNVPSSPAEFSDSDGVSGSKLVHSFPQRFREAFEGEMDTFADVLLTSREEEEERKVRGEGGRR